MAHRSEKGSVIGFVLVGTALAAAFVGGVYMVRHSGELNSTDTQQTAQTSQSETTKNDQKTQNEQSSNTAPAPKKDTNQSNTEANKPKKDEKKKDSDDRSEERR